MTMLSFSDFEEASIPLDDGVELFGAPVEYCHYKDLRNPPGSYAEYELTKEYWHTLSAKLGLILTFV